MLATHQFLAHLKYRNITSYCILYVKT